MSTRASFIIRKGGIDKELYNHFDGYPSGLGRDVLNLIKTTNVHLLYDLLIPSADGMDFSAARFEEAVGKMKPYEYRQLNSLFIQDSLSCEYAYVIDIDDKKLFFYVGFQHVPQEGNRYGVEGKPCHSGDVYYPCRLSAIFSFSFICATETAGIVELMEKSKDNSSDDIEIYDVPAAVINVPESLSTPSTENADNSNTAILDSIKTLLLYGPLGPEIINDIARLNNISVDTVKEVVKRMRV